jgi:hypothetical protein
MDGQNFNGSLNSVANISGGSSASTIAEKKRNFSSSFAVTSATQKRRAQRIRAQNRLKDSACKAQLELDEERERHKCELSEKKEQYSEIVDRYKADRASLSTQLDNEKRISADLKLRLEKFERKSRDLSTGLVKSFLTTSKSKESDC